MRLRHTHTPDDGLAFTQQRFHTPSHTVTNRSHFMSTCNEHESHSRPHQPPPHTHTQRQPLSILSAQRPSPATHTTPHIQVIHCHSRTLLPVAYAYTALKTTGLKTNPPKLWAAPLSGREEEEDERRILCKVGSPKRCTLAVGKRDDVEEIEKSRYASREKKMLGNRGRLSM